MLANSKRLLFVFSLPFVHTCMHSHTHILFYLFFFLKISVRVLFVSVMLFFLSHGVTVREPELPDDKSTPTGPSAPVVCPLANHWANIL